MEQLLKEGSAFLKDADNITFISHADADGLCATAILHKACKELGKKQETFYLSQISTPALEVLAEKSSDTVIFIDMGSSHLPAIKDNFKGDVLVIDHHQMNGNGEGILVVNPFLAGLEGTRSISTSGIAYNIVHPLLEDATHLLPIALIGAQGDNQEAGGFQDYNKTILEEGKKASLISTRRGARLYGIHSRKIVKLLMKSFDLKMAELKTPRGAKEFLKDLRIRIYDDDGERMFNDLSKGEQERLESTLIERSPHPEPEITHYLLRGMPDGPLQDTREASTLLNACGRLGKPALGVSMLLGEDTEQSADIQQEYGQTVHKAHVWFDDHQGSDDVIEKNDLVLMNARENIPADLAGTLCSVITRSREVPPKTIVICLARNMDGTETTKVSARSLANSKDLAAWLSEAAGELGGEGGGHAVAAGAVIPTEKEDEFIELLLH